jgi:organic hydroperoxide reductase OsmC/OhrA
MNVEHHYAAKVLWTGNRGTGTSSYRAYDRSLVVSSPGKAAIDGSSDRTFHGDATRWNPEELLLVALSQCHMLSYLHEAVLHGIVVESYEDDAIGTMQQTANGGGHFTSVTLRPVVQISAGDLDIAQQIHRQASQKCFIAASVNFAIDHEPTVSLRS